MKLNKKGIFSTSEMMVSSVIVGSFLIAAYFALQYGKQHSVDTNMNHTLYRIQTIINDVYFEQNPNEYPADNLFPNQFIQWVTPTNLQDAQELMDILNNYCRTFQGVNFNVARGQFTCTYRRLYNPNPETPPETPPGGGHPPPAGIPIYTTTNPNFEMKFVNIQINETSYCLTKVILAKKKNYSQSQVTEEGCVGFETSPLGEQRFTINVAAMPPS